MFRVLFWMAAIPAVLALPVVAQEHGVGAKDQSFRNEVSWETLKSKIKTTEAKTTLAEMRLEQAKICNASNLFYAPGHAEADSRGCLRPYRFRYLTETCNPPSAACITGDGTICGAKGASCAFGNGAGRCGPYEEDGPTWPTTRVLRCE